MKKPYVLKKPVIKKAQSKPKKVVKKVVKKSEKKKTDECKWEKDIIAASFKKMKAEQAKAPVKTSRSSVSKHKKAIQKKYNGEITDRLFEMWDEEFNYNDDALTDEIYDDLISNKRGNVADTAIWASQNKEAGKKAVKAVIKKLNKGLVEEQQ